MMWRLGFEQGTDSSVPQMPQNHPRLQPLRDTFADLAAMDHFSSTPFSPYVESASRKALTHDMR
jgi:hypothetical protein